MKDALTELLESEVLGQEVKTALQEAFDTKIKLAETKLQEDYAARYAHDKAVLVEAMDNMLSDAIATELREFNQDRQSLNQQRVKLSRSTLEAKKVYEQKMRKHMAILNKFITQQLEEEISEFAIDRKQLIAERKQMTRKIQMLENSTKSAVSERVSKLETFVLKQLSEELTEFQTDKRSLVEQRVKLATQGRKKIQESRDKFVARATTMLDKTLNEVIRSELMQWRQDIKVARENNFGRRIFEAVASEYMASYLSEGSEVKKLQRQLAESRKIIAKKDQAVKQQQALTESVKKTAQQATDRAQRLEVLNELTGPLNREKKTIMVEMLAGVKTANLKEAFNRYLPAVVNGNAMNNAGPRELTENVQTRTVATGNRSIKLVESTTEEDRSAKHDIAQILHLAGVNNQVREN